jgi:acyl-CoA thioester hydrolase
MDASPHHLSVRVYYEDTDFSGLVYHASYLRFMERGRTEYLRAAAIDQSDLHQQGEGLFFAVRRMTIDWLKPARMDDMLTIMTQLTEARGASLVLGQQVLRRDEILLKADVRVALLHNGRPARLPDELRQRLSSHSG